MSRLPGVSLAPGEPLQTHHSAVPSSGGNSRADHRSMYAGLFPSRKSWAAREDNQADDVATDLMICLSLRNPSDLEDSDRDHQNTDDASHTAAVLHSLACSACTPPSR